MAISGTDDVLKLIGRDKPLFDADIQRLESRLNEAVKESAFLVIGGGGSIGQAVVKELFARSPKTLHVVDISENNLVELVRDIRSSLGYIEGDFKVYPVDCGSIEFEALLKANGHYDYIFNLSALKHVRSEKDPFTLMRMIQVNVLNSQRILEWAGAAGARKYFAVSTDKAANPVNMMGASKRIMEMFLFSDQAQMPVSTARFANVAFSDGSLLQGFNYRMQKQQPISAPLDVRRYFITPKESGQLCVLSCIFGENRDIFFPKLDENIHLVGFADIARRYLEAWGFAPYLCQTEDEARARAAELIGSGKWPCYFFNSDTTGEKGAEEFYTASEALDFATYVDIGIVKTTPMCDTHKLDGFVETVNALRQSRQWRKEQLVELFNAMIPEFRHDEKGKYLDARM